LPFICSNLIIDYIRKGNEQERDNITGSGNESFSQRNEEQEAHASKNYFGPFLQHKKNQKKRCHELLV
jgi:hypothetical protein